MLLLASSRLQMGTILDALAARGVRGALQTLLSPQQTQHAQSECPDARYVCARKNHHSGRKGQISVYRVHGKLASEHGQAAKLYSNVQAAADLDDDERGSFAGIGRISSHGRGCRVRQKMGQAADELKKSKREAKTMGMKAARRSEAGPIKSAKRNGTVQPEAFAQDQSQRPGPSAEDAGRRQQGQSLRQRCEAPSDPRHRTNAMGPHRSVSHRQQNASRPRERTQQGSVQQEPARPASKDAFERQLLVVSTVAKPWEKKKKKGQQAGIAVAVQDGGHGQMKVSRGDEHDKQGSSVAATSPSSSFRQPGMTSEASDALVFGLGSQAISRSDLRADLMHDCIAPDVHTHASPTIPPRRRSPSQKVTGSKNPSV